LDITIPFKQITLDCLNELGGSHDIARNHKFMKRIALGLEAKKKNSRRDKAKHEQRKNDFLLNLYSLEKP